MADICTTAAIVYQTLVACTTPPVCHMSADGTKKLCTEGMTVSCGSLQPRVYECVREDGTKYQWTEPRK